MPETQTLEETRTDPGVELLLEIFTEEQPYEDNDDPNRRTHIINAEANQHVGTDLTAQEIVDTARLKGQEIVMLCGFRFVPKHNPEKYDACNSCVTIAHALIGGS